MGTTRPTRRRLFARPVFAAGMAALVFLLAADVPDASDGDVHVAGSVCEAQALRARAADDPHFQIEIPAEYNQLFPTLDACLSHEAAADPDAPGPLQPIEFSHKHHSGKFGIDCQYCHSGSDRSQAAGVPSVELCMGCHAQFPPAYDELAGIRTLRQHWEEKTPIVWEQIHRLPEHVQFRHNRHVQAGVTCQRCHGPVEEMDKLYLTADTVWWPWLLPSRKLEMGWCVKCHRQNEASQDCQICHY